MVRGPEVSMSELSVQAFRFSPFCEVSDWLVFV